MNCYWNFFGNSRVQVVVPRRPRLLPLAPFTLYVSVCINAGLGSSLSKHALHTGDSSDMNNYGYVCIHTCKTLCSYIATTLVLQRAQDWYN